VFPAAVRPEPGFRLTDNILLQAVRMPLGDLAIAGSCRVFDQLFYVDLVMAPLYFFYKGIHNRIFQLTRNTLCAQEYRRVLVEKGHPVGMVGMWRLIGNKGRSRCLGPVRHHLLKGIFHGDQPGAEAPAHLCDQTVHIGIGQRVVDHIQLRSRHLEAAGIACPFPVALVSHDEDHALSLCGKVVEQLLRRRLKAAVTQHRLGAYRQCFEGFQEQVAEMAVKFLADLLQLCFFLPRERTAQVLQHQPFTVADQVEQDQEKKVGEGIQQRERQ